MSNTSKAIEPGEALSLQSLITPTEHGVASRLLARNGGGSLTLFAFDAGEGMTEHTSTHDALVLVLDGAFTLTIAGAPIRAVAGTITFLPADVPHAVDAAEPSRMLLMLLRDRKEP